MSEKIICPCITYAKPMCGDPKCWHHQSVDRHKGGRLGDATCLLCHCTGRVLAGTVKKAIRRLRRPL